MQIHFGAHILYMITLDLDRDDVQRSAQLPVHIGLITQPAGNDTHGNGHVPTNIDE